MTQVTIEPEEFKLVEFDRAALVGIIEKLLGEIGLDGPVTLEIDQTTPLGHTRVVSVDPIVLFAESGALEDPRRLRQLSPSGAALSLGRLLLKVSDRRDAAFCAAGAPPDDKAIRLEQAAAWDTYCFGRLVRLGYSHHDLRQSRLYNFRTRHGFSDTSDAVFDALWTGEGLTWADIDRMSSEAAAARAN